MLLIVSNQFDKSTNDVIDWLNIDFQKIAKKNYITNLDLFIGNDDTSTLSFATNKKIEVDRYNTYWYRRDDFVLGINSEVITEEDSIKLNLEKEWDKLKDFLHTYCESKN